MEKKRMYLFDNLKFLLMVLVVAGHFIDNGGKAYWGDIFLGTYVFIYAFHMPLFIFISGLFYKEKDITRKVFFYASTGIILNIFIYAAKQFIYHYGTIDFVYIKDAPWFMFALAAFTALTYLLRNVDKRLLLAVSFLLALFAGYSESINAFLSISRIIVFYPFYLLGVMLDADRVEQITRKRPLRILGASFIILWGIMCSVNYEKVYTLRKLFTGANPYYKLIPEMEPYGWEYRLLCYGISLLMCFAFISIMPSRKISLVSNYGTRTLQIYFWHLPLIYIVHILGVTDVLTTMPWGGVLCIIICVAITLILSQKPFKYPTELIRKYTFIK